MSPRKRSKARAGWPDYLNATKRPDGRLYYWYKRPGMKSHGFGYDKKKAFDAAKQLNQLLGEGKDLVAKVMGNHRKLSDFADKFTGDILPSRQIKGKPLSESTLAGYRQRVAVIVDHFGGHRDMESITLREIAEFLDSHPPRMSNVYRATLVVMWRYAKASEWVTENRPETTIKRDEAVKRKPLTLDGFKAVRARAPAWFQKAMDIALESLQGRSELSVMRWPNENGIIRIIRKKVDKYETSRVELHVWPELGKKIDAFRDELFVPFVIHRKPERKKAQAEKAKHREHQYQVLPEQLSREFAKARDKSGFYSDMEPAERPTFHEIRALGADLKRKDGWPEELIQKLMSHSDVDMTKHYLDKHEKAWIEVKAPSSD